MSQKLNVTRAANILVDADAMGDVAAAKKWGVDERTIRRYRVSLAIDPDLSVAFREKTREAERSWHLIRNRFLRDVTEHLRALCMKADKTQIDDVRAAVKDIGELDIAREALGVGVHDHQQGQTPPEAPSGAAEGGARAASSRRPAGLHPSRDTAMGEPSSPGATDEADREG